MQVEGNKMQERMAVDPHWRDLLLSVFVYFLALMFLVLVGWAIRKWRR